MPDASIHGIEFEVRGNADSAASSVKKLSESLSHLRSAASGQKSSLKSIAGGLKSIASVAKQGAASLASFGKNLLLSPLKTATKNMAAFAKRLSTVAAGFKRILGYRLIRTLIKEIGKAFKEGTQNLYQYSSAIGGTFAANMNDAATSMLYFKNSIGAAWSPLMNLLAPAIRVVTDAAVALLNVLNQLIALLTGASGWTRATRKATEYGEAVGGAGGAAKEALKYLAPFDELNVLPDDKKGGGGGGGNLGYDDMFEEMTEFESGLADFANRIRDAIERADWQGLGQILGDKVNDLVDMVPWEEIGTKVGSKINAFFTTRYWTLETINFQNIGANVAELLNHAFEEIDFEIIGRGLTQKLTNLGDFIIGAISNTDWQLIGDSLGDLMRGAFDQVSDWLDRVNWGEFGNTLFTSIQNAITGIDFDSLAASLLHLLGSALGASVGLLSGVIKGIGESIVGYFESYIDFDDDDTWAEKGGKIVSGIYKGITAALVNVKTWVRENFLQPFIDGFLDALGLEEGNPIVDGIAAWIQTLIKQALKKVLPDLFVEGLFPDDLGGITPGSGEHAATSHLNLDVDVRRGTWDEAAGSIVSAVIDGTEEVNRAVGVNADLRRRAWDATVGAIFDFFRDGSEEADRVIGVEADLKRGQWDATAGTLLDQIFAAIQEANRVFTAGIGVEREGWTTLFDWFRQPEQSGPPVEEPVGIEKSTWFQNNGGTLFKVFSGPWGGGQVNEKIGIEKSTWFQNAGGFLNKVFAGAWNGGQTNHTIGIQKSTWFQNAGGFLNKVFLGPWGGGAVNQVIGLTKQTSGDSAWTTVSEWIKKAKNWGTNVIKATIELIKGWAGTVTEWVKSDDNFGVGSANVNVYVTRHVREVQEGQIGGGAYKNVATGGVFANGAWHNIAQYASGGLPIGSQLFWAREAGPELVGTLGGHTAVMNNDQIVASVSAGVARAISSIRFHMTGFETSQIDETESEDIMYRAFRRALAETDFGGDVHVSLDGDPVYSSVVKRNREETYRTGVNPMLSMA